MDNWALQDGLPIRPRREPRTNICEPACIGVRDPRAIGTMKDERVQSMGEVAKCMMWPTVRKTNVAG
eukprot:7529040-Pyramimonas_sp.AAC.1